VPSADVLAWSQRVSGYLRISRSLTDFSVPIRSKVRMAFHPQSRRQLPRMGLGNGCSVCHFGLSGISLTFSEIREPICDVLNIHSLGRNRTSRTTPPLGAARPEEQIGIMEAWFRARYEDPPSALRMSPPRADVSGSAAARVMRESNSEGNSKASFPTR
jgi:hypothetical protein